MKTNSSAPAPRQHRRRPLREALLVGAKLAALSAAHPATVARQFDPATGRHKITGRLAGLKGYLLAHGGDCPYPSAMRYCNLAQRLSRALALPAGLTLEALLARTPVPAPLADAAGKARAALDALLAETPNMQALSRRVDDLLGNA